MRARGFRMPAQVLVLPFAAVFALFVLYPLALSLVLSTRQTFGPDASRPVGLDNYAFLLRDPMFHRALLNTLMFTAGSVFIQLPIALGLALLLNRPDVRARGVFRLVFFSPQLVGLAFVAIMSAIFFQKRTGLLNRLLHSVIGFDLDHAWLETSLMTTLIVIAAWLYVGFNMIYFLAALQNVDRSQLEAARMDGAGGVRRFLAVTLPAIRPVASLVVLLSIIGSLQLFELPYIMLEGAGPDNRGLTIVFYLYQMGFETGDLGYASAIGWVLALMILGATLAHRALSRGSAA